MREALTKEQAIEGARQARHNAEAFPQDREAHLRRWAELVRCAIAAGATPEDLG